MYQLINFYHTLGLVVQAVALPPYITPHVVGLMPTQDSYVCDHQIILLSLGDHSVRQQFICKMPCHTQLKSLEWSQIKNPLYFYQLLDRTFFTLFFKCFSESSKSISLHYMYISEHISSSKFNDFSEIQSHFPPIHFSPPPLLSLSLLKILTVFEFCFLLPTSH